MESLRNELQAIKATVEMIDGRLELGNQRFEQQERRLQAVEKWQGDSPDAISLIVDLFIERTFTYQNLVKLGALITVINGLWFIIGRML